MNPKKYPLMGQIYTTPFIYVRTYKDRKYTWELKSIDLRAGWVTRYFHLKNGNFHSGSGYGEDYDPGYFVQTSSIPCIMLTFWPTMKPIPVSLNHLIEGGTPRPSYLPWTEAQKQSLREDIKNQPRKNGKFVKL